MDHSLSSSRTPDAAVLRTRLAAVIAEWTGHELESVQPEVPFNDYGLTSLQLVDLVRRLEPDVGRKLSPTLAWEFPTIARLAAHLGAQSESAGGGEGPGDGLGAEEIAIVGMACRFPGAPSLEAYWRLCWEGIDAVGEVPAHRWNVEAMYDADPAAPGKTYCRWGGFLDGLDGFDAGFFGISPREAAHLDPRQRLMMELSWEAWEDAGIPPLALPGGGAGIFVSTLTDDYGRRVFADRERVEAHSGTGTAHSMVANRLSYFYDLHGPSLTIDTACSGSLVAIHLACQSLRARECGLALAGGVNVLLSADSNLFFSRAGALARDGRCKAFDRRADGFVRSEGAGLVVLKRAAEARTDGDRIYAVIRGSAVNQDGRTNGVMAPSPQAQEAVLRSAYRSARVLPGHVQYVEAHGTGTQLGDPIEANALGRVLREARPAGLGCLLGSVKTNIGHTEAAAGIAGVIKTAMALHRGQLPGSLHFREANPLIDFEQLPFRVAERSGRWPDPSRRLIAGVSGFGFGGTNAHVVLAAADRPDPAVAALPGRTAPLFLSAHCLPALRETASRYAALLRAKAIPPADLAAAASARRSGLKHRLFLSVATAEEAAAELCCFAESGASAGVVVGTKPAQTGRLAFIYSGQGTHWAGMGLDLMPHSAFARTMRDCDELFRDRSGSSLLAALEPGPGASALDRTDLAQAAVFSIQASLTGLLRSMGIVPEVVFGQSLGEIAAAYAAGALSLEDAFRVVWERAALMRRAQGHGRTAQIAVAAAEAEKMLAQMEPGVAVAGASSPVSSLISGEAGAVERVVSALGRQGIFARLLRGIDLAFHGPQMDALADLLPEKLAGISPRPAEVPFFSSVRTAYANGARLDGAYWADNLRKPFRIDHAIRDLLAEGITVFLEVGPHAVLQSAIAEGAAARSAPALAIPTLRRNRPGEEALAGACGRLFLQGHSPRWFGPARGPAAGLPSYPWQRERHWIEEPKAVGRRSPAAHPFLGEQVAVAAAPHQRVWEVDLKPRSPAYLADHKVFGQAVFPGSAYAEMALAALGPSAAGGRLDEVKFLRALPLPAEGSVRVQLVATVDAAGAGRFEVHSVAGSDGQPEARLLATGGLRPESGEAPPPRNLDEIRSRCPECLAADRHYLDMAARGVDYGPAFRSLAWIQLGSDEAFGSIRLPDAAQADRGKYRLHPVCLDALFQLVAPLVGDSFLPVGMGRLRWFQKPGPDLLGHVRLRRDDRERREFRADLELLTLSGEVVAEVEDFGCRRVGEGERAGARISDASSWTYELGWEPETDRTTAKPGEPIRTWILLGGDETFRAGLSARLAVRGHATFSVAAGEGFREIGGGRSYTIDPECPGDYRALLERLGGAGPVGVVGQWALDTEGEPDLVAEKLTRRTLVLLQSIGAVSPTPRLYLLTRGAQAATAPLARKSTGQAALWGLGRVAFQEEMRGLAGGLIDLDPREAGSAREFDLLVDELEQPRGEDQLAIRNGAVFRPRLGRRQLSAGRRFAADCGGAYLITGGLGAIGLEAARWLERRGARRIVLMGRTGLPPRREWKSLPEAGAPAEAIRCIRELERRGCSVEVVALDVGNRKALDGYFRERREQELPPILGVMHAAGLMKASRIGGDCAAQVGPTLLPKVRGAVNLWRALGGQPVEFFALFSSFAGLLPGEGQAAYAAANAFLDGWAAHLRGKGVPALSIAWGPWQVGMMNRPGQDRIARGRGLHPMEPGEALDLLDGLLRSGRAQAVVAAVDWDLYYRARSHVPPSASGLGTAVGAPSAAAERSLDFASAFAQLGAAERRPALLARIAGIIAEVFRSRPGRIDPEAPLVSAGLDSLMATELKDRLQLRLGLSFSVVDLLKGLSPAEIVDRGLEQLEANLAPAATGDDDEALARELAAIEAMTAEEIRGELVAEEAQ